MTSIEMEKSIVQIAVGILENRRKKYRELLDIMERDTKNRDGNLASINNITNKIGAVNESIEVLKDEYTRL